MELGFPCGLTCKEFACNVGDLGLNPGSERSPGEGKCYPVFLPGTEEPEGLHSVGSQRTRHNLETKQQQL